MCHLGDLIHPHFGLASWTIDLLLWGWKAFRIFNRFTMAKITGISDLGLYCRFMLLWFEYISYRERPSRKRLEHTELERAPVNWMALGGFGRPDVESGRPVRSLFWMDREHHGMGAYRWSRRVGRELTDPWPPFGCTAGLCSCDSSISAIMSDQAEKDSNVRS